MPVNSFGQPVGGPVQWSGVRPLAPTTLAGRTVTLAPLDLAHTAGLWQSLCVDSPAAIWTYLFSGPYDDRAAFDDYLGSVVSKPGTVPFVVLVDGRALGHACLMRDDPAMGAVEVGNIALGAALQRTTAATEMLYLLARHVFESGYRRFEWKCDSLNEPSRRAAERFGFAYEGRFRQAVVYKSRNRDTDWFAMTDGDWAGGVRQAFESWLNADNFDADGQQRGRLEVPTPRA